MFSKVDRRHRTTPCRAVLSSLFAVSVQVSSQWAQSAVEHLETVEVIGHKEASSVYFESQQDIAERLLQVPGGTNLIELGEATKLSSLSDALNYQPGIIVQEFFGGLDQPRINVRGSGIQGNPVSRGILLRQDYLPLNEADGSFIIGLLNLRNTATITAHRGANSRAPGSFTLGGDLNFISNQGNAHYGGHEQNSNRFVVEQGSFDQQLVQMSHASDNEAFTWHGDFSHASATGFRHHSASERTQYSLNFSLPLNGQISNASYVTYTNMHFDMPFVLPKQQAESAPQTVFGDGVPMASLLYGNLSEAVLGTLPDIPPALLNTMNTVVNRFMNIYDRDPHRNTEHIRIANRSSILLDHGEHTLSAYWQTTNDAFVDPFSHMETKADTIGAQWIVDVYPYEFLHYQIGLDANRSNMPRRYTANHPLTGRKIEPAYADLDLNASNYALSLLFDLDLLADLSIIGQWQFGHSKRYAVNKLNADHNTALPSLSHFDKRWDFHLPKLGLIYRPRGGSRRWFMNVSKSIELPTFWEIVGIDVNPLFNWQSEAKLQNIDPQQASSVELGGQDSLNENLTWQLTLYHSQIKQELISTASQFGVIADTENYHGITVHQGIEFGINGHVSASSNALLYRASWTFSDFYFADGEYADNQIAGVPRNVVMLEGLWQRGSFKLGPNLRLVPDDNPVDHANSLGQGNYALLGFSAEYQQGPLLRCYLVLDNITDEIYNASFVVRGKSDEILPTFLPGNGFSVNAGMQISF